MRDHNESNGITDDLLTGSRQACTWNDAFPLALMWSRFKAAENDLNQSQTSVESLKVCSRMNVVNAQRPQPINKVCG